MARALLLALSLAACTASTPREYRQGVYRPPPPPELRPGHGAPMVGQPGARPEDAQRSPHSRPLPPSPEPGLWAGDGPRAARGPAAKPVLLGVDLPALASPGGQPDYGPSSICAAMWEPALVDPRLVSEVRALAPRTRRCVVAEMFQTCARIFKELDDGANKQGVPVLHAKRLRAALKTAAADFLREACGGAQLSAADRRLLDRLTASLRHIFEQPE